MILSFIQRLLSLINNSHRHNQPTHSLNSKHHRHRHHSPHHLSRNKEDLILPRRRRQQRRRRRKELRLHRLTTILTLIKSRLIVMWIAMETRNHRLLQIKRPIKSKRHLYIPLEPSRQHLARLQGRRRTGSHQTRLFFDLSFSWQVIFDDFFNRISISNDKSCSNIFNKKSKKTEKKVPADAYYGESHKAHWLLIDVERYLTIVLLLG